MLWSSITLPSANGIATVPSSSVWMIWSMIFIKSILFALVLLKRQQLLDRYSDVYELTNQGEFGYDGLYKPSYCYLIIKMVPTSPSTNSSRWKSLLYFVLFSKPGVLHLAFYFHLHYGLYAISLFFVSFSLVIFVSEIVQ